MNIIIIYYMYTQYIGDTLFSTHFLQQLPTCLSYVLQCGDVVLQYMFDSYLTASLVNEMERVRVCVVIPGGLMMPCLIRCRWQVSISRAVKSGL